MKKHLIFLIPVILFLLVYLLLDLYSAITLSAFSLVLILLIAFKKDIADELIIAMLFALFITYNQYYVYEGTNFFVGAINVYTFILWTLGLIILREFYEYVGNKFILSLLFFFVSLFAVEYVGYYLLGFHRTGNYPGIFGLEIIHGPPIVHWFYMLSGPAYLLITKLLKIK